MGAVCIPARARRRDDGVHRRRRRAADRRLFRRRHARVQRDEGMGLPAVRVYYYCCVSHGVCCTLRIARSPTPTPRSVGDCWRRAVSAPPSRIHPSAAPACGRRRPLLLVRKPQPRSHCIIVLHSMTRHESFTGNERVTTYHHKIAKCSQWSGRGCRWGSATSNADQMHSEITAAVRTVNELEGRATE